jgi:predicted alpha/beta superfamily hydrolase
MSKYTVLLLRPDYLADCYGLDTYTAHVTASNVASAVVQAQTEVFVLDHREANNPQDYACIGLFDGHQINRAQFTLLGVRL